MPIYDFKCPECETAFDAIVPLSVGHCECPHCGSIAIKTGHGNVKSYKIKGDNSASITPKKHRGSE